jgi:hypothetical protein
MNFQAATGCLPLVLDGIGQNILRRRFDGLFQGRKASGGEHGAVKVGNQRVEV